MTLLSTAFNCALLDTGNKHWKTNEPVKKHDNGLYGVCGL